MAPVRATYQFFTSGAKITRSNAVRTRPNLLFSEPAPQSQIICHFCANNLTSYIEEREMVEERMKSIDAPRLHHPTMMTKILLTVRNTKIAKRAVKCISSPNVHQPPDTARSWGRLPSRLPPLAVITTVSPQVQSESPSAEIAEGLQINTMFSCSAVASWRGLLA